MENNLTKSKTLAAVMVVVERSDMSPSRRRDMISAIRRVCEMAGILPAATPAVAASMRAMIGKIRPALHEVSAKSWSNIRSLFVAALELAEVIDSMGRGSAVGDPAWGPLMGSVAADKRVFCGLAAFANWSVQNGIAPSAVDDAAVQNFLRWREARTLCPKPRDMARRVPNIWNEASQKIAGWPRVRLSPLSFRAPPQRVLWDDLTESFRADAEAYLRMRAEPDLFDERETAPRRPLAPTTIHLQLEQLHSAVSVLIKEGVPVEAVLSLADLVTPDHYKSILRHLHNRAGGKPNAFLESLARTLRQVAKFHVRLPQDGLDQLGRIAAKLPATPFDLTEKNKTLLRELESERLRAKLIFLPDQLIEDVVRDLAHGRLRFVYAQMAIAIAILLAAPLRPENLCQLIWKKNFSEPDGSKGRLLLFVPAADTKTGKQDYVAEVPDAVARQLRWYRAKIMPGLEADVNGHLFVSRGGGAKSQETVSQQLTETIANRIGLHMTGHQFRHLAATLYLEAHPEDFETARALLGHRWGKTTLVYAGSSSRRASKAYGRHLLEQREALRLSAGPKLKRPKRS